MMKMHRFLPWFLPLLMLVAIFLSIVTMAQDVLRIGAIYSLTGPTASVARLQKSATELAIKDLNNAGGINVGGKKVKLEVIFGDDQSDAATAATLLEDMVKSQGIAAVIGGTRVHNALSMNTTAKENPVFRIATCAVPDAFHHKYAKAPTTPGIMGGALDIDCIGASYLADKVESKRESWTVPAVAFNNGVVSGFDPVIKKPPDIKYNVISYSSESSEMTRHLRAVSSSKPGIVMAAAWRLNQIVPADDVLKMGRTKQAKFCQFWLSHAPARAIPPEGLKGVWPRMFWDHDMTGLTDEADVNASDEFVAKFGKAYSEALEAYAMCAYFAVKEVARDLESAQNSDPMRMSHALSAIRIWTGANDEAKWRKNRR